MSASSHREEIIAQMIADAINTSNNPSNIKVCQFLNDILEFKEAVKTVTEHGVMKRVPLELYEYVSWKLFVENNEDPIYPDIYNNVEKYYYEDEYSIKEQYRLVPKNLSETIAVNTDFWNKNYFIVPISAEEYYYVPYTTIMNGEVYRLLQDDLPIMMLGIMTTNMQIDGINNNPELTEEEKQQAIAALMSSPGVISYLDMYTLPDFSQQFTEEYMQSLLVRITDMSKITTIVYILVSKLYESRTVPSLV